MIETRSNAMRSPTLCEDAFPSEYPTLSSGLVAIQTGISRAAALTRIPLAAAIQQDILASISARSALPYLEFKLGQFDDISAITQNSGLGFTHKLGLSQQSNHALLEGLQLRVSEFMAACHNLNFSHVWIRMFCRSADSDLTKTDFLAHVDKPESWSNPSTRYIETLAGAHGTVLVDFPQEVLEREYEALIQICMKQQEGGAPYVYRDDTLFLEANRRLHRTAASFRQTELGVGSAGLFRSGYREGTAHFAHPQGGARLILSMDVFTPTA